MTLAPSYQACVNPSRAAAVYYCRRKLASVQYCSLHQQSYNCSEPPSQRLEREARADTVVLYKAGPNSPLRCRRKHSFPKNTAVSSTVQQQYSCTDSCLK